MLLIKVIVNCFPPIPSDDVVGDILDKALKSSHLLLLCVVFAVDGTRREKFSHIFRIVGLFVGF